MTRPRSIWEDCLDNASFARQRADRKKHQLEVPGIPVWPTHEPFDGFAVWQGYDFCIAHLRPWRNILSRILRFSIPFEEGTRTLLVGLFESPQSGAGSLPRGALPLRRVANGKLASAGEEGDRASPDAHVHTLSFFWQGRHFLLSFAGGDPVGMSSLWDAPELTVHSPKEMSCADEKTTGSMPTRPGGKGKPSPTTRSNEQNRDPFRQVTADMERMHENTRLINIFKSLFTARRKGGDGSAEAEGEPQVKLMDQLSGWLRWHSPLRPSLKRLWKDRANLVEDLIRRGDADLALKLAIKLGSSAGPRNPKSRQVYPSRPGMRTSLDLSISNQYFVTGFMDGEEHKLRQRYAELAERLEAKNDFLRAAFVHSQLLGHHAAGVGVLERGGFFREAAKLALDAHQPPETIIRLHFLAGEHAAALSLARRYENFHLLASLARNNHPEFHQFVLSAWTDRLLAMGAPLMALQVTDDLISAKDSRTIDAHLLERRREWLMLALEGQEAGAENPEIEIRSLLAMARSDAENAIPKPSFPATPENLLLLQKLADPKSPEQTWFWSTHAAAVIDGLVRQSLVLAGDNLYKVHRETLLALCRAAGLEVLRFDVARVALTAPQPKPGKGVWTLPAATPGRAVIRCGCVLDDGRAITWRDSGMIELWSTLGKLVWMAPLQDVIGLVAAGVSSTVLILQQGEGSGTVRLSRLVVSARRIEFVDELHLRSWHDATGDATWLVQIDGEVGALDLTCLLGKSPRVEFIWSVQVTNGVLAVSFFHQNDPQWITYDAREGSGPVYEMWKLMNTGEIRNHILCPEFKNSADGGGTSFNVPAGQLHFGHRSAPASAPAPGPVAPFGDWCWTLLGVRSVARSDKGGYFTFNIKEWSLQAARRARLRMVERFNRLTDEMNECAVDRFLSGDLGRCEITVSEVTSAAEPMHKMEFSVLRNTHTLPSILFRDQDQLSILMRGREVPDGAAEDRGRKPAPLFLCDAYGRLIRVDLASDRVDIFT